MTTLAGRSPWLVAEGVLLILLGIAALVLPLIAGLAATQMFGWVLILAGIFGLFSTFAARVHMNLGLSLASAIIALLAGVLLVFSPLAGVVGLTILIGAYLFLDGVTSIAFSVERRKQGIGVWGWLLASGIIDLVLAAFIVTLDPLSSAVLIGIIIGVDLIAGGIALMMMRTIL